MVAISSSADVLAARDELVVLEGGWRDICTVLFAPGDVVATSTLTSSPAVKLFFTDSLLSTPLLFVSTSTLIVPPLSLALIIVVDCAEAEESPVTADWPPVTVWPPVEAED